MSADIDALKPIASPKKSGFSNRYMTILVTVSSAVGFGNIWRFPYLVYRHGGLGFIIIYLLVLCLVGIPVLVLESGVGQTSQGGQNVAWSRFGRYCRAPGWTSWTSVTISCYYALLLAWSFLFFVHSFRTFGWENPAHWKGECAAFVDEPSCLTKSYCSWRDGRECLVDPLHNTRIFFRETINAYTDYETESDKISLGGFSYQTFLALLVSWVFIALCIFAGARIFSYTTYFTMVVPGVLLVVLVVLTATFEGAGVGIVDYIGKFKASAFTARSVIDALTQSFFSLSLAQGTISALASHGGKNDNFVENSVAVAVVDTSFAILAGFAVFGMVGFLAVQSKLPISALPISGISLAFTAYPSAMAQLNGVLANITSIMFFFTLWLIGVSTLCTLVECIILPVITSRVGIYLRLNRWKTTVFFTALMIIVPEYLMSSRAGFILLDAMDNYSAMAQVLGGGSQAIALGWFYLQGYSMNKVGKAAILTHAITFGLGPTLLGLFFGINATLGFILGVTVPVVGFIVSIYLAKKTDSFGNPLTWKEKVFYLTDYNIQPIRTIFNNSIAGSGYLRVPRVWNFLIKYVTSYSCIFLFFSDITTAEHMYGRPNPQKPYPWYVFLISQLSPFMMMLVILITFAYPNLINPLLEPKSKLDENYIVGEDEMKKFDYEKMNLKNLKDDVKP